MLLAHYGNGGSRYENPRVIDMVEDMTVHPGSMAWLLRLLKSIDRIYSEECQEQHVLEEHPEEYPLNLEESPAAPVVLVQKATRVRASPSRPRQKTKRRKLNASRFVDIVALDDDDDDDDEEEEEEEEEEEGGGRRKRPPSRRDSIFRKTDISK